MWQGRYTGPIVPHFMAEKSVAANVPQDPVGGALTGLQHKEVGLLRDNIIKGVAECQASEVR